MALYHAKVGIPKWVKIRLPKKTIPLFYSYHAHQAALYDKRFGNLTPYLPREIDPKRATAIEVETNSGTIVKVLFRQLLTQEYDLCLAVEPSGFVRTVWAQDFNDNHKTLDRSRYSEV